MTDCLLSRSETMNTKCNLPHAISLGGLSVTLRTACQRHSLVLFDWLLLHILLYRTFTSYAVHVFYLLLLRNDRQTDKLTAVTD